MYVCERCEKKGVVGWRGAKMLISKIFWCGFDPRLGWDSHQLEVKLKILDCTLYSNCCGRSTLIAHWRKNPHCTTRLCYNTVMVEVFNLVFRWLNVSFVKYFKNIIKGKYFSKIVHAHFSVCNWSSSKVLLQSSLSALNM